MIDILMSTYNGAGFIEPQIASILEQDRQDFRLIIRDDGSTDATLKIIQKFRDSDPRIEVVADEEGNLGVSRSFFKLLELSDADLFMLADQDDVWSPHKISSSIRKLEELASRHGNDVPLLVFTDLVICDANLERIHDSLWEHQKLDPEISRVWKRLLAQNVVTGCTIVGNAAARRASLPFVLDGMFHDHWIAVNAARTGAVDYLPSATVFYRQHLQNAEGAKYFGYRYAWKRSSNIRNRYRFYQKAGKHFGVSANLILFYKIVESIRRLTRK